MKELLPIKINYETNISSLIIKTKIDPWKDIVDLKKMECEGWFTKYHGEFDYYRGSEKCCLRAGSRVYPAILIADHDNLYIDFVMPPEDYEGIIPTNFEKKMIVLPPSIISYIQSHAIFEFGYQIFYFDYTYDDDNKKPDIVYNNPKLMRDKKIINLIEPMLKRKGVVYMNFDWKTLQLIQDQDALKCLAEGHYPAIMPYCVVDKKFTEIKSGILYQRMLSSCCSKNKKFEEKIRSKIDYETILSILVEIGAVHRKLLPMFSKNNTKPLISK